MADQLSEEEINEFRDAFATFDRDNDGAITTIDLGIMLRSLGGNPSDVELKDMINEVDSDGNGTLDFPEFLAMVVRKMRTTCEEEVKEVFRIFDKEGDGYISRLNIREVMRNLGEELTEKQIDEMLQGANIGSDEYITYEGFLKMMMPK